MRIRHRLAILCCFAFFVSVSLYGQGQAASPQEAVSNKSTAAAPPVAGTFLSTADRQELIRRARKSYYGLKEKGLSEYHFEALPDWDVFYQGLTVDSLGHDQLLPILKKVRIQVVVGPTGACIVSHQSDVAPPSQEVADRLRQTLGGVDQMMTGFFQTWTTFSIAPAFPEVEGEYQIEDLGATYRITYKEGDSDVTTLMNHDLSITELAVTSPNLTAKINPIFTPGEADRKLASYNASYKTGQDSEQSLAMTIENGDVDGLQLPKAVKVTIDSGGRHLVFPFTFVNGQAKKH